MHESEKKCIGIDVGGTSVKIGLFETDGTLLFKWEVPTRKEEGGRYILEDVAASIMALKAGAPDTHSGSRTWYSGTGHAGWLCGGLRESGLAECKSPEGTQCHAGWNSGPERK